MLLENDGIYALGDHVTLGGPNADLDAAADVNEKLKDWKRDRAALMSRFDANKDGEVGLTEWEKARHAAAEEVTREHPEIRLRDGVHVIRRPADGRFFLVSNQPAERLVNHFRTWARVHLFLTLVSIAGAVWVR